MIAYGLSDGAVGLSVRFWFEPQGVSEQDALDAATRAVPAALREAGIELIPPRLQIDAPEVTMQQKAVE